MTTHTHPAGTTVRYDGTADFHIGKMFTVLDPDAPANRDAVNDLRRSTREFVEDGNGLHCWLEADMLTPVPTLADEYPVGCTVRDVKYNLLGTVTGRRQEQGVPVLVVQFPASANTIAHTASFAHPEGRLERVHILTHEELVLLDAGLLQGSIHGNEEAAGEVLDRHLRPTRTATFMVTVEQPADAKKPVDPWYIEHMLTSGDQTGLKVTITEAVTTTKEN